MSDEIAAFDKWVEEMGWAAKWEAKGKDKWKAEGEKTGWKKALDDLLKRGYTVEDLERMSPTAN